MVHWSFAVGALIGIAVASPLLSPVDTHNLFRRVSSGCSTTGTASCRNTTTVADTCCFEAGGLLSLVQFWDADPPTGPSDSWTIHGLWPDWCDGTYSSTCDPSRAYTNIPNLLTSQGASDTLSYMQTFWRNLGGTDESLWEHEWSKHGTCMSTLRPSCLPSGSTKGAEAVAFYQTVVNLFKALPTYTWLQDAGISPSSSTKYTRAQLAAALKARYGYTPSLDCQSGAVYQVSYYYNLKGSVIDGAWIPIDAPSAGSCPSTGISYKIKTVGSTPTATATTKTTTTAGPTSTAIGLPTRAKINALSSSGSITGGLLTAGTWSTQTLATITISGSTSSFTISTSKGSCGVISGALTCGSGITASTFSAVSSGNNLLVAYGGSTAWTSDGIPSGSTVYTVYPGSTHSADYSLVITSA